MFGISKIKGEAFVVPLLIALAALVSAAAIWYSGKDDTVAEEVSEQVIEGLTGVDIDFTPNSPED